MLPTPAGKHTTAFVRYGLRPRRPAKLAGSFATIDGFPWIGNRIQEHRMRPLGKLSSLVLVLCVSLCSLPHSVLAQDNSSSLPDAPSASTLYRHRNDPGVDRRVSLRSLPKDFLYDQKGIWLFPTQLARGQHWLPTLVVAGGTAGLLVADSHAMPYFQSHAGNLDDINDVFASPVTTAEVIGVPVSLLVAGYVRHDRYQVDTALLAGEAYADSAVVDLAMKAVTRRKRPSDVAPNTPFTDTFFAGGVSPFKGSSFPSGHAASVFSVATVVASRYQHHKWVPVLAYGFATVVSFSRVTTSSHFPSDVFVGAALGYTIARYEVLRPR